ncbi:MULTISPECIES: DUF2794 domain-containing protein [unclassified Lentilitoribacter]|jgi:hypothetical protein|uniref:DUF2794 domain-containing protein n=1 Tax=unclassified Lentilitoribacter TaxID=2647570 RepID=UPI0013A6BE34|nr:DUF2794 domain-containing protein [Lentilitoribacter sp. Alg239-R112]
MTDGASGIFNNSNSVVDLASYKKQKDPLPVTFHRTELDRILQVYSRNVGTGAWRDYAIDHMREKAVFSIYKQSSETPLFTIEKDPKRARKQGAFSVINANGLVLKRGHELAQVLKVLDKVKVVK